MLLVLITGPARIPTPDPVTVIALDSSSESSDAWDYDDYDDHSPGYDLMDFGMYNSAYYGGYGR